MGNAIRSRGEFFFHSTNTAISRQAQIPVLLSWHQDVRLLELRERCARTTAEDVSQGLVRF